MQVSKQNSGIPESLQTPVPYPFAILRGHEHSTVALKWPCLELSLAPVPDADRLLRRGRKRAQNGGSGQLPSTELPEPGLAVIANAAVDADGLPAGSEGAPMAVDESEWKQPDADAGQPMQNEISTVGNREVQPPYAEIDNF